MRLEDTTYGPSDALNHEGVRSRSASAAARSTTGCRPARWSTSAPPAARSGSSPTRCGATPQSSDGLVGESRPTISRRRMAPIVPSGAGFRLPPLMSESADLRALFHRLNNQLGIILAHAELLEAKAADDAQPRARGAGRGERARRDDDGTRFASRRSTAPPTASRRLISPSGSAPRPSASQLRPLRLQIRQSRSKSVI